LRTETQKKMYIKKIISLALIFALTACQTLNIEKDIQKSKPKNLILFIGDGMGPAFVTAYRLYRDNPNTPAVETILFDEMLVGSLRTDPLGDLKLPSNQLGKFEHSSGAVTDSAASGTAYATGKKALNGYISLDENKKPLPTVLEKAKQVGMSTGLVVTSQLSHATPAVFASHQESRSNHTDIVNQYIDNRFQGMPYIDVLLGGGKEYFVREDRNVVEEFAALDYQILTNKNELESANKLQLLGLFADSGLKKMIDRDADTPSLSDMTRIALRTLSNNDKGFFLMVEGSQIDWAGHGNDIVGAMSEMADFDAAVLEAIKFAKIDGQTQIVVTADHSTGGLSIGSKVNGKSHYQWKSEVIRSFSKTPEKIVKSAIKSGDLLAEIKSASGLVLTEQEINQLKPQELSDSWKTTQRLMRIIDQRSYTGWTTTGHTGVDVNLYAYGSASGELVGHWDNTKLAEFMFKLIDNK